MPSTNVECVTELEKTLFEQWFGRKGKAEGPTGVSKAVAAGEKHFKDLFANAVRLEWLRVVLTDGDELASGESAKVVIGYFQIIKEPYSPDKSYPVDDTVDNYTTRTVDLSRCRILVPIAFENRSGAIDLSDSRAEELAFYGCKLDRVCLQRAEIRSLRVRSLQSEGKRRPCTIRSLDAHSLHVRGVVDVTLGNPKQNSGPPMQQCAIDFRAAQVGGWLRVRCGRALKSWALFDEARVGKSLVIGGKFCRQADRQAPTLSFAGVRIGRFLDMRKAVVFGWILLHNASVECDILLDNIKVLRGIFARCQDLSVSPPALIDMRRVTVGGSVSFRRARLYSRPLATNQCISHGFRRPSMQNTANFAATFAPIEHRGDQWDKQRISTALDLREARIDRSVRGQGAEIDNAANIAIDISGATIRCEFRLAGLPMRVADERTIGDDYPAKRSRTALGKTIIWGQLRLRNAVIENRVLLDGIQISHALLEKEEHRSDSAYVLRAIDARCLHAENRLEMGSGCDVTGAVDLTECKINGDVECRDGTFRIVNAVSVTDSTLKCFNILPEPLSLMLNSARIRDDVELTQGFKCEGRIELDGALIEGDLDFRGAKVGRRVTDACDGKSSDPGSHTTVPVISGDRLTVRGTVRFRHRPEEDKGPIGENPCDVHGGIRMRSAKIHGNLDLDGCNVEAARKTPAIDGTSVYMVPEVDLTGTSVRGALRLGRRVVKDWPRSQSTQGMRVLRLEQMSVGKLDVGQSALPERGCLDLRLPWMRWLPRRIPKTADYSKGPPWCFLCTGMVVRSVGPHLEQKNTGDRLWSPKLLIESSMWHESIRSSDEKGKKSEYEVKRSYQPQFAGTIIRTLKRQGYDDHAKDLAEWMSDRERKFHCYEAIGSGSRAFLLFVLTVILLAAAGYFSWEMVRHSMNLGRSPGHLIVPGFVAFLYLLLLRSSRFRRCMTDVALLVGRRLYKWVLGNGYRPELTALFLFGVFVVGSLIFFHADRNGMMAPTDGDVLTSISNARSAAVKQYMELKTEESLPRAVSASGIRYELWDASGSREALINKRRDPTTRPSDDPPIPPEKVFKAATIQFAPLKDDVPAGYPVLNALAYSIDSMLPIISLRQHEYWIPTADPVWNREHAEPVSLGWHIALRFYTAMHIALGWTLSIFFVIGLTGVLRTDRSVEASFSEG